LAQIKCSWKAAAANLDPENIYAHLTAAAGGMKTLTDSGDVVASRAQATHVIEATYEKGYVAHAAIEPHAALAEIKEGKATIWASTQTPFPTRDSTRRRSV
jgi:CO/xanthine dehydrogenase Mo-binding subunit